MFIPVSQLYLLISYLIIFYQERLANIRTWISYDTHRFVCGLITYPNPDCSGGLVTVPLILGHGCVIICRFHVDVITYLYPNGDADLGKFCW